MNDSQHSFQEPQAAEKTGLKELALMFLRLGTTAFGGPAAHIAIMEDEFVRRRRWITREKFLDLRRTMQLTSGGRRLLQRPVGRDHLSLSGPPFRSSSTAERSSRSSLVCSSLAFFNSSTAVWSRDTLDSKSLPPGESCRRHCSGGGHSSVP
ncbi:MAG: chromate transporter [Thermoguttaceae bacterium]